MKDKTKKTWIKIGSIAWKVGLVTVLNTGSIFAVVSYNFVEVGTTLYNKSGKPLAEIEVSYWEALTNKMFKGENGTYKPYNVWLIWLSVIAGAGLSLWFLYLVYKSKVDKDKEDREDARVDKMIEASKEKETSYDKETNKKIEKMKKNLDRILGV